MLRAAKLIGLGAALVVLALAAGNVGQVGIAQQYQYVGCPPTQPFTYCSLSGHTSDVFSVAFSPDGQLLASASCGQRSGDYCIQGEIKLWDISDLVGR